MIWSKLLKVDHHPDQVLLNQSLYILSLTLVTEESKMAIHRYLQILLIAQIQDTALVVTLLRRIFYQIKLTDHGLMKTTQIFCMTPYLVLRQMEVQSLMQIFQTEPMK